MSLLAMCQPNILNGGPGGIRTPVQNTFLDNSLRCSRYYIFIFEGCQLIWCLDDNWPQSVCFGIEILLVFVLGPARILPEF